MFFTKFSLIRLKSSVLLFKSVYSQKQSKIFKFRGKIFSLYYWSILIKNYIKIKDKNEGPTYSHVSAFSLFVKQRKIDMLSSSAMSSIVSPQIIIEKMPQLVDPKPISSMTRAYYDIWHMWKVLIRLDLDLIMRLLTDLKPELLRSMINSPSLPASVERFEWWINFPKLKALCEVVITFSIRLISCAFLPKYLGCFENDRSS